jgi:hypothetical protein
MAETGVNLREESRFDLLNGNAGVLSGKNEVRRSRGDGRLRYNTP